ncbi:MAG: DUF4382 domain-containing protein [Gammaproteobacteria bacterium]
MTPLFRLSMLSAALLLLSSCGGGGGDGGGSTLGPQTATVGIALTDAPTTDIDQALATITSVELIGDGGRVSLFSGTETVDLLKLGDYSELFAVRNDVPAGNYNKIRMQVSNLDLIRLDAAGNVAETLHPKLVANGKIDLNPRGSFHVAPGATLMITLDFDMNKSLKITETGNGKLILRPVIFVDIANGIPSPGLTRIHGRVTDIGNGDDFRLCQTALAASSAQDRTEARTAVDNRCVRVRTDGQTGIFGSDGLPQALIMLAENEEATVIGRLRPVTKGSDEDDRADEHFALDAYVVEEGPLGTFRRLRGAVAGTVNPGSDQFSLDLAPGQGIVSDDPLAAQLYPKSRVFSRAGVELTRADVTLGVSALVDAVLAVSSIDDVLRTALVVIDKGVSGGEKVVAGSVLTVDVASGQLLVATDVGDRCIDAANADVFLVGESDDSLASERGTLSDLSPGQSLNIFGRESVGGCLIASTILAERD